MKDKVNNAVTKFEDAVEMLIDAIRVSIKHDGKIYYEYDLDDKWGFTETREVNEDGRIYNEDDYYVGNLNSISIDELYKIAKTAVKE